MPFCSRTILTALQVISCSAMTSFEVHLLVLEVTGIMTIDAHHTGRLIGSRDAMSRRTPVAPFLTVIERHFSVVTCAPSKTSVYVGQHARSTETHIENVVRSRQK